MYFCAMLAALGMCLLFGSSRPLSIGTLLTSIVVSGAAAGWFELYGGHGNTVDELANAGLQFAGNLTKLVTGRFFHW